MKFERTSIPLALAFLVALAALPAGAQNSNLPNLSDALQSESAARNTRTQATTGRTTGSAARTTGSADSGGRPLRSQATTAVITGGGEADTGTAAVPTITGATDSGNDGGLPSGLPTLAGAYKIVPASVPPIAGAPYMQTSSLPEGTVFIAVGAILGFLAMSVLLWRALVAWSLHRSVKRASQHTSMADTKALFGQNTAPIYSKYKDRDSTIELSSSGGKANRKSHRPQTAPGAASASSLFYSPTAGVALQNSGNRGSNYLPAGYYAAGASTPGNHQSHITIGQGPAISLSTLGPQAQGYSQARSMGPSPPESPSFHGHGQGMQSSSTLNLNKGYGGTERAPSAYLDDLFDGNPSTGVSQYDGHRSSRHERY